jgi:hypothetical protein
MTAFVGCLDRGHRFLKMIGTLCLTLLRLSDASLCDVYVALLYVLSQCQMIGSFWQR